MKKGYKIALIVIIVLIVILVFIGILKNMNKKDKKELITINILDTISQYNYSIDDRDSEYYKEEFNNLKNILNADVIDYKSYSEQVAKMFVMDLYSIKTKVNKYDVGGLEFYHTNQQKMHEKKVENTLYDYVQDDSYGDRKQKLPLVTKVTTVSVNEVNYTMDDNEVSAYEIELIWEYETDMGYDNKGKVIVTKDGIKQSVVSYQPINNQE